jgi:hypothetical protein
MSEQPTSAILKCENNSAYPNLLFVDSCMSFTMLTCLKYCKHQRRIPAEVAHRTQWRLYIMHGVDKDEAGSSTNSSKKMNFDG